MVILKIQTHNYECYRDLHNGVWELWIVNAWAQFNRSGARYEWEGPLWEEYREVDGGGPW